MHAHIRLKDRQLTLYIACRCHLMEWITVCVPGTFKCARIMSPACEMLIKFMLAVVAVATTKMNLHVEKDRENDDHSGQRIPFNKLFFVINIS